MDTMEVITDALASLSHHEVLNADVPLIRRAQEKVSRGEPLVFVLPAFPAKSPSPMKTLGELPDLGEVLALQNLQRLCERISKAYGPGAKVILCSDGRVFSDVVRVSDLSIDRYNRGISEILRDFRLDRISMYTLDDLRPELKGEALRSWLLNHYAVSREEIRSRILSEEGVRRLYNGLHRFLLEDEMALFPESSKSRLSRETKERTVELMRRSEAWSRLLEEHFRDELRLSIHPYPPGHEKFGVRLVPGTSRWATPWHNVAVKIKDRFELMHLSEALKLNVLRKTLRGKYVYLEVPTP